MSEPTRDEVVFMKAMVLQTEGKSQEARRVIEDGLHECPQSAMLSAALAEIQLGEGEIDGAEATIRNGLRCAATSSAHLHLSEASLRIVQGKPSEALEALAKADTCPDAETFSSAIARARVRAKICMLETDVFVRTTWNGEELSFPHSWAELLQFEEIVRRGADVCTGDESAAAFLDGQTRRAQQYRARKFVGLKGTAIACACIGVLFAIIAAKSADAPMFPWLAAIAAVWGLSVPLYIWASRPPGFRVMRIWSRPASIGIRLLQRMVRPGTQGAGFRNLVGWAVLGMVCPIVAVVNTVRYRILEREPAPQSPSQSQEESHVLQVQ